MHLGSLSLASLSLLLLPAPWSGAAVQEPTEAEALELRLDALASSLLEEGDCRGLVVLAAVGGAPVVGGGWGTAAEDGLARRFRVGSLVEAMTEIHTLQLVAEGRLALEDPVSKYLPELRLGTEESEVTVRDLLAHTSGLPDYVELDFAYELGEEAALLTRIAALPLETAPGSCCSYSHSDALALGLVLERVHDAPLGAVLGEVLFEPLGLTTASSSPLDSFSGDRAQQEIGMRIVSGDPGPQPFGAELLVADAEDLLRWQRGLVEEHLTGGISLLELLDAPEPEGREHPEVCASAFRAVSLSGFAGVAHGGGLEGDRVHLVHYPELDLDVIVLAHGPSVDAGAVGRAVARAVFDLPSPDLVDLPLTEAEVVRYAGTYQVGCTTLRIAYAGGRLELNSEPHGSVSLLHQGGHVFLSEDGTELRLTFQGPADGLATGFQLEEPGSVSIATRFE